MSVSVYPTIPVLNTISPKVNPEYPNPIPSKTEPSLKISFPNLFACLDSFTVIVTLEKWFRKGI